MGGFVYNSVHNGTLYNFTNTGKIKNQDTEVTNPSILNGNAPEQQKDKDVAACLVKEDNSITVYETAAEAVNAAGTANKMCIRDREGTSKEIPVAA